MSGAVIIMVSAKDMPSEQAAGIDAGADDYLTKPFDEVELLRVLRNYVDHRPVEAANHAWEESDDEVSASCEPGQRFPTTTKMARGIGGILDLDRQSVCDRQRALLCGGHGRDIPFRESKPPFNSHGGSGSIRHARNCGRTVQYVSGRSDPVARLAQCCCYGSIDNYNRR